MTSGCKIMEILDLFVPIGLEEMDSVRLMDRVDTKYIMALPRIPDLLIRMGGRYRVLDISKHRLFSYLTTYLDTDDYMFYNQHITGRSERHKIRYRKYETTGTTYLEVKKRTIKNRTIKWRIENDLTSNKKCDDNAFNFINEYIPQKSLILDPVIINKFKRITLVGSEICERITIDYDLSFSSMDGRQVNFPFIAIIELKRQGLTNRSQVENILKENSIRPTSFSKYCIGAGLVHDLPRKNMLKEKFLLINKIENEHNKYPIT
jgi:hypothetical protein